MAITKSDLPINKITANIGAVFSKVMRNSGKFKKTLDSGLAIGDRNDSLIKQIEEKKKSMATIQALIGRKVVDSNNLSSITNLIESLKGLEKGGPMQSGRPYLVGEAGPEVVIPASSGQVISNNNLQSIIYQRDIQQLNRSTTRRKVVVQPIVTTNTVTKIIRK